MNNKQKLLDEYAEFLIYNGFDVEGMGCQLKGLNVEEVNKEDLQEAFELIDEINKKTQEFKSKFYEVQNELPQDVFEKILNKAKSSVLGEVAPLGIFKEKKDGR